MLKTAGVVLLVFDAFTLVVMGIDIRVLIPSQQVRQAGVEWLASIGSSVSALAAQVAR
jgi:hypothetical protein